MTAFTPQYTEEGPQEFVWEIISCCDREEDLNAKAERRGDAKTGERKRKTRAG